MAIESSGTEDDTQVLTNALSARKGFLAVLRADVLLVLQWLVYWLLYSLLQGFEKFAWPVLQW